MEFTHISSNKRKCSTDSEDIKVESTIQARTRKSYRHSFKVKTEIIPFTKKTDLKTIILSPVVDNLANDAAFPEPFTPVLEEYKSVEKIERIDKALKHWKSYYSGTNKQ